MYLRHSPQPEHAARRRHRCKEQDAGRACNLSAEPTSPWLPPTSHWRQPIGKHLESSQVRRTVPSEATTGSCTMCNIKQLIRDDQDGSEDLTQEIDDIDPWLTSSIQRHQHKSDGHQCSIGPSKAVQSNQPAPSKAATHHQAPILTIWENFVTITITSLRRLHGTMCGSFARSLRTLLNRASTWRCSKRHDGPPSKDAIDNGKYTNIKGLEVLQGTAASPHHATVKDIQQKITGRRDRLAALPPRGKQAGIYTTHTQCLECYSLVELDDVGYEDELCDRCMGEAIELYWGPPQADYCTEDDSASRGPHGDD